jgi:tetratricopeptide (TPR) repeat protein
MRAGARVWLSSRRRAPLFLTGYFLALLLAFGPASAEDDIEHPADVAPDGLELRLEDDLIEPEDFDPEALMRPDVKQGGEDGPPPQSTEESKRDKLSPDFEDLPLPAPADKPKVLGELYAQLAKARDEKAAQPIIETIEALWRLSGSDTVDLLMQRAEHFAKQEDLDLALQIMDATVDIAPDQAEAWHLRAKVHFLKQNYEQALTDLRRVLDRDPKHYAAMNDLGVVLESIGAKKEALEAYRKALVINPFLTDAKKAVDTLRREVEGQDI